jgi:hypothetical protein
MFALNRSTMSHGHGFEGNWLPATRAWDSLVKPLFAKTISAVR